jgi:hypothetical protein
MSKQNFCPRALLCISFALIFMGALAAEYRPLVQPEPLASVSLGWREVYFRPKVSGAGMELTVSQPDGLVFQRTFAAGATPVYDLPGHTTNGTYTYELRLILPTRTEMRVEITESEKNKNDARRAGLDMPDFFTPKPVVQSGHFVVRGGSIQKGGGVEASSGEKMMRIQDVVHNDDVIITGSLAVGFDAVNGENFGFDTIRLKENNLRVHFDDTSTTGSYPKNDWRITINDSTNGGASYFSIDDATNGTVPFKVEADAPSNSIFVDDYGRVGFGTATPAVELHSRDSDTPTLRLHQDSSGGWTAQTWDVAGNESNFFIRDVTNGSKLPVRIQPGTPSSTFCLKSDGKVGFGTWSPGYAMELEKTGTNAAFILDRTDGAMNYINATADFGNFGTVSNHPLGLAANSLRRMVLWTDNSLTMNSGASCTAGGVWQNSSSRSLKENITELPSEKAFDALDELNPVMFNYKADLEETHVGFIAEDVPDVVASKDRKSMSPMDVVAVLTKVVKEQQKTISDLQQRISELEDRTPSERKEEE